MTKRILIILTILLLTASISFAADTPEEIITQHYQFDLAGDIVQLMGTYNLDYINRELADTDTFKEYIESAKLVYTTVSSEVSNIMIDYSEDQNMALAKFDVLGEFKVIETGEILPLSKTYGAFVENTSDGWKINFIMDYDLMAIKLEAGSMYALNLLTEEIAEEALLSYEMHHDDYGTLISDPEIAIASLQEFNQLTEEALASANIIEESTDQASETLIEETIQETEMVSFEFDEPEKKKSPLLFAIPLLIIVGGAAFYLLVLKKNK